MKRVGIKLLEDVRYAEWMGGFIQGASILPTNMGTIELDEDIELFEADCHEILPTKKRQFVHFVLDRLGLPFSKFAILIF